MAWDMFDARRLNGDGTATYFADNQAVRLRSMTSGGPNRAILDYRIPQVPGLTVTWSYAARITEMPDPTDPPFGAIDLIPGGLAERWDYTTEWREYRGSYTVPYTAAPGTVTLALGVFTSPTGEIEATRPRITLGDDAALMTRVVAFEGNVTGTGEVIIPANTGVLDWRRYDFASVYVGDSLGDDRLNRIDPLYVDLNAYKRPDGTFKSGWVQSNATFGGTTTIGLKADIIFNGTNGAVQTGGAQIGTPAVRMIIFYRTPFVNVG